MAKPKPKQQDAETQGVAGCLIVIFLAVVGAFWLFGGDQKEPDLCRDGISAKVIAETFVRRRLKAPSTADFAGVSDAKMVEISCGTWRVVSYVDSQNSFGAKIRTHFAVTVEFLGKDKWVLRSMKILK